jgi:hypothetical protein
MEKAAPSDETINGDGPIKKPRAEPPLVSYTRKQWRFVLAGGLFLAALLALALGLGLGLGLKRQNDDQGALAATASSTTTAASPTPTLEPSGAPASPQSWRSATLDYDLDMSWNISAAPTTRIFNLTVSEIQAAPDGEFLLPVSVR